MRLLSMTVAGVACLISSSAFSHFLHITPKRDLVFSPATSGEAPETLSPQMVLSSQFTITGRPYAHIEIKLPSGAVCMSNGSCTIDVDRWTCDSPLETTLGPTGNKIISIGATRVAFSSRPAGNYVGTHTIGVRHPLGLFWKTATAKHSMKVIKSIALTKRSDLIFPAAYAGDPTHTVTPRDTGRAIFSITGEPHTAFHISLPSSLLLTTAGGNSPDKTILINSFSSLPLNTGILSSEGTQLIAVGATHSAIRSTQVAGDYAGQFSVTVSYQ